MSLTHSEKQRVEPKRKSNAPVQELPEFAQIWLAQQNPSPLFTMNKQETADYLSGLGFPTNKAAIVRAIYDGKLASKLAGKKRLVSRYDALVYALSGREFFGRDESVSA